MAPAPPADAFIIVRPPPSVSVHPLNLQIQYVTPTGPRDAALSRSGSSNSGESTGTFEAVAQSGVQGGRKRATSVSSETSSRSGRSGSFGASNSRRLIPLYNLGFHKLTPTTITDAGTDAKIAKFLKRGVEILDLVILDPTASSSSSPGPGPPASSSVGSSSPNPSSSKPTPPSSASSTSFFSKVFNKKAYNKATAPLLASAKDVFTPESQQTSSSLTTSAGDVVLPLFRTASMNRLDNSSEDSHAPPASENGRSNSKKKQLGYTWSVRKWLRKDLQGEIGSDGVLDSTKELSFEWKRADKRPSHQVTLVTSPTVLSGSGTNYGSPETSVSPIDAAEPLPATSIQQTDPPSLTTAIIPLVTSSNRPSHPSAKQHTLIVVEPDASTPDPNNLVIRPPSRSKDIVPGSVSLPRSPSHSFVEEHELPSSTFTQLSLTPSAMEESSDSDSEDSERPWMCALHLPSSSYPKPIHLATLRPAPHHPKLVAQLLVPWSLAPVEISNGSTLSTEELKDLVAVMALWITVREGLGGLTKSGAKGRK